MLNIHDKATIEMYHPEKGYIEYETEVSTQNVTTVNRYFDDQVDRSWIYYTVPVLKQSVEQEWKKVIIQSMSYLTFGTLTYYYGQEISNQRTDFKHYKQAYINAETAWDAAEYREKMRSKHTKLDDLITVQNVMIGGLVATYLAGAFDALFIQPRKGYKGASKFDKISESVTHRFIPEVSIVSSSQNTTDRLTIKLSWGL